jgi:hypothetical protein
MIWRCSLLAVACSLVAGVATAGETPDPRWPLNLPVLDYPFNRDSATAFPSMQQSLALTVGFYELTHVGLQQAVAAHPRLAPWSLAAWDIIANWLPLGNSWLHEEWHRAAMGVRGIDSHNGIYDFEFSNVIKVTEVGDGELSGLKLHHPADQVRLSAAGIESQYELNLAVERSAFFHDSPAWTLPLLWLNVLNAIGYLHVCATSEADSLTERIVNEEGVDTAARDFTGLDCNAWVYDLFRPDEPYAARGAHPSGVGIDRYRDRHDLSERERSYLLRQRNLSLLNLIDPFLFARDRFVWTPRQGVEQWQWNANLRHHLAPFGYDIAANVFLRRGETRVLTTLHSYVNDRYWAPGLDIRWDRLRGALRRDARLSARLALWQQPKDLRFDSGTWQAGGLGNLSMEFGSATARPFIELEYKTAGWVAGNEYLDAQASVRVGIVLWLGARAP